MASNPISNSKIASNLKKLRAEKVYFQERVARLADLSLNTIIHIGLDVNKNQAIGTLAKLAHALACPSVALVEVGSEC